ncbi:Ankyrin repeat protein [Giardia duodenalis]|uniref:Ankyrin repeat protein n=1 Tax=Giardia intestinalis TaxID=5741 RepID=V6T7B4_GIAIN|nr:Ankyrin repeat protein [Giardia intestinalis]
MSYEEPRSHGEQRMAFIEAAKENRLDYVRAHKAADAGQRDTDGKTALMWAAEAGHTAVALELVDAEAGLVSNDGSFALIAAAKRGNLELIQALFEKEGRLRDAGKLSALNHASRAKQFEAAKVLRLKTIETMDAAMLEQLRQRVAATYTEMAKKSQQAEVKSHNMAIFRSFFEAFYSLSCSGIDQGAEISEEQLNKSLEKCLGEIRKLLNSKKYTKCVKCRANAPNLVCMPCKHYVLCKDCGKDVASKVCPACNKPVEEFMEVFK